MLVVRTATIEEWQVLRDIRLAALRDAPNAFGSTYARQAASAEADWRRWISRGRTFFAYVTEVNVTEVNERAGRTRRLLPGAAGHGGTSLAVGAAASAWPGRRPGARGRGDQLGQGQERRICASLAD